MSIVKKKSPINKDSEDTFEKPNSLLPRPGFRLAPNVKMMFNVGACLDIPTGTFIKGKEGEWILNGGLGSINAVVGIGNNFKSTLLHYMCLSAASKVYSVSETYINTYDTEINMHEDSLKRFITPFEEFKDIDIFKDRIWEITDKTIYQADEWFDLMKDFLKSKMETKSSYVDTPFLDRDGKTLLRTCIPTFTEIDSFSKFTTTGDLKMMDENSLGESGANTLHMRQGMAKSRFLSEIPALTAASNNYLLITAWIGKEINMASGPYAAPPPKKLQYLKNGDSIKGVSGDFFYAMASCWHSYNASPYTNQGTKGPEYPKNNKNVEIGDTDLNIATLRQLRCKSGPTGVNVNVLVSQKEGVLSSLTEFDNIKHRDRFGLGGNDRSYYLELYPEVLLSRTTVRPKLDEDPLLRRAMNITSELCQMHQYMKNDVEYLPTAKELFDSLKEQGYDLSLILKTRGWATVNNYTHPTPFLSTKDLVEIYHKRYFPYWMSDDKKGFNDKWSKVLHV